MEVKGYTLVNEEKINRVLNGVPGTDVTGIAKDNGEYDEADLLAQYDKLGGLIKNADGYIVKTGSFYNLKAKAPHKKPEVVLQFRVNGRIIELAEGEKLPLEIQAAQMADAENAKDRKKKKGSKSDE